MNKNKGFIGIGLIVAIVLGIVVVGGGAYYLEKSGSKLEVKSPENVLPNIENQELPIVENKKTNTTSQVVSECDSNSKPSIKILSPNGEEVFKSGDRITVKWSSCNILKSAPIKILLQGNFSGGTWNTSTISSFNLGLTAYSQGKLLNSGLATHLTIPVSGHTQWSGYSPDMKYGTYYKVYISQDLPDSTDISDASDNLFTINSLPTETISMANWKTYTNMKYGFELKYPNDWVFSTFPNPDGFFFNDKSKNKFTFSILPRGGFDHGYEEEPVISDVQINGKQVKKREWNNSIMYQFIDDTIPSTWIRCGLDLKSCNRIEIQESDKLGQELIDQVISTFKFTN